MKRVTLYVLLLSIVGGACLFVVKVNGRQARRIDKAGTEAARKNAVLRRELNWTFGGKPQRGWYIYEPLIKRLINTQQDAASRQFSSAVGRWQEKSGLKPGGIIDEETLYAMIKAWQDARLKDRSVAQPDQLMLAPIAD